MAIHSTAELEGMFDRLWRKHCLPEGSDELGELFIEIVGPAQLKNGALPGGEAGHFERLAPGREFEYRCIRVRHDRAGRWGRPTSALSELIVLAHELGHWQSWRDHPLPRESYALFKLPPASWRHGRRGPRRLVLAEERRAWSHAARHLADVGFDDRNALYAWQRVALASYERRLGLPRS